MISRYLKPLANTLLIKSSIKNVNAFKSTLFGFKNILSYSYLNKQTCSFRFSQKKPVDQQFKNQSNRFYQNYVQDIIELQKSEDWQMVLSNTVQPLIIDFYADWCGPCKKLTPILQQRVKKTQGKVKLLKVNIDKCGQLANTLKIKSVPTVFAVYRGQGFDSFQGIPQESKLSKMFQTIQKISSIASLEDQAVQNLTQGKNLLSQQKFDEAEKIFQAFSQKGIDEQLVALKEVLLAQCYFAQRKIGKFKDQIQRMKRFQAYYMSNPELKDFYTIVVQQGQKITLQSSQNPQLTDLKGKISSEPTNLSFKYELAQFYKKSQMIEECLEVLIQMMKADKNWEDKKANKFILAIFKELGNTSPLTQKYRKLMQRIMY